MPIDGFGPLEPFVNGLLSLRDVDEVAAENDIPRFVSARNVKPFKADVRVDTTVAHRPRHRDATVEAPTILLIEKSDEMFRADTTPREFPTPDIATKSTYERLWRAAVAQNALRLSLPAIFRARAVQLPEDLTRSRAAYATPSTTAIAAVFVAVEMAE
ncbi:MAG: hypothetical protein ACHRXM_37145 [Isosphaerales bacterium]